MKKLITTTILYVLTTYSVYAQVAIASIFNDNMVLQRNVKIPVWGTAAANEKITVNFRKQIKTVLADKKGNWKVMLNPENVGESSSLVIKGKQKIVLKNIKILY